MISFIQSYFHMALSASVVILVILLVRPIFKKASNRIACLLWAVVIFRLLCPFTIIRPNFLPGITLMKPAVTRTEPAVTRMEPDVFEIQPQNNGDFESVAAWQSDTGAEPMVKAETSDAILSEKTKSTDTSEGSENGMASDDVQIHKAAGVRDLALTEDDQQTETALLETKPQTKTAHGSGIIVVLGSVWMVGALILLGVGSGKYVKTVKKLQGASCIKIRHKYPVKISDAPGVPMSFGVFCPAIYMPKSMEDCCAREMILMHEEMHLRHHDPLWKVLSFVALCVHWWNPLVWFAVRCMNQDLEMACDEAVLAKIGQEQKKAYATTLLEFASEHGGISLTASFGESHAERRILNVLKYKKVPVWGSVPLICSVLLLGGCLATTASGATSVTASETTSETASETASETSSEGAVQDESESAVAEREADEALKTDETLNANVSDTDAHQSYAERFNLWDEAVDPLVAEHIPNARKSVKLAETTYENDICLYLVELDNGEVTAFLRDTHRRNWCNTWYADQDHEEWYQEEGNSDWMTHLEAAGIDPKNQKLPECNTLFVNHGYMHDSRKNSDDGSYPTSYAFILNNREVCNIAAYSKSLQDYNREHDYEASEVSNMKTTWLEDKAVGEMESEYRFLPVNVRNEAYYWEYNDLLFQKYLYASNGEVACTYLGYTEYYNGVYYLDTKDLVAADMVLDQSFRLEDYDKEGTEVYLETYVPDRTDEISPRRGVIRVVKNGSVVMQFDLPMHGSVAEVQCLDLDGDGRKEIYLHGYVVGANYTPQHLLVFKERSTGEWDLLESPNMFPVKVTIGEDGKEGIISCAGLEKTISFDTKEYYQILKEQNPRFAEDFKGDCKNWKDNAGCVIAKINSPEPQTIDSCVRNGRDCLKTMSVLGDGRGAFNTIGSVTVYFDYDENGRVHYLDLEYLPRYSDEGEVKGIYWH